VKKINEFRFIIETLGIAQVVKIEFLTTGHISPTFDVIFKPNVSDEVSFIEYSSYEDDELTELEAEIAEMFSEGIAIDVIAEKLYLPSSAVKTIVVNIYDRGLLPNKPRTK
jgi:DNA-binding NarL/FixJ family response regulator